MANAAILRETVGFLRWRLVPVRKLGKLRNRLVGHAPAGRREEWGFDPARLSELENRGFTIPEPVDPDLLAEIRDLYLPRGEDVVPTEYGHPFVNLVQPEDFHADNPLFRLAFSDHILAAADGYFNGAFSFSSLQVAWSFPTGGALRESQMWHRDYGDNRSLHFIMYLNDVTGDEGGPFVFIDKQASRKVARSPIIRRLSDDEIAAEIGSDTFETFYGRAGDAILMDPAACYHFGSRCKVPRAAAFITFNTHVPYTEMMEPLATHRAAAAREARKVRPDLPGDYIDAILQV